MSAVKRSMIATVSQGNLEMDATTGGFPVSLELMFAEFYKGDKGDKGDDGNNGQDGERGSVWYAQDEDPQYTIFPNLGDMWLDTSTYNVYQYRELEEPPLSNIGWVLVCNIKGSVDPQVLSQYVSKSGQQIMEGSLIVNSFTSGGYSEISKSEIAVNEIQTGGGDRKVALGYINEGSSRKAVIRRNANGVIKETKIEDIEDMIKNPPQSSHIMTYNALVQLRDSLGLVAGDYYRINDYQCTTIQEGTTAANNKFDIVVMAVGQGSLNENAIAVKRPGYFTGNDVGAWKLKYCLDNDTDRFAWADPVNGKGVVYWMMDEYGNEAPYDFKNIKFTRYEKDFSNIIDGSDYMRNVMGEDGYADVVTGIIADLGNRSINGDIKYGFDSFWNASDIADFLDYCGVEYSLSDKYCSLLQTEDYCQTVLVKLSSNSRECFTFDDGGNDASNSGYVRNCVIKPCYSVGRGGEFEDDTNKKQILNCGVAFGKRHIGFEIGENCQHWTCCDNCSYFKCGSNCSHWTCDSGCDRWICGSGSGNWSCAQTCSDWHCGQSVYGWYCGERCCYWNCNSSCAGLCVESNNSCFTVLQGVVGHVIQYINNERPNFYGIDSNYQFKVWNPADLVN